LNTEARTLRQYAELIRAGHPIEIDASQFGDRTAKDLSLLLDVTRKAGGPIAKTLDRFAKVLAVREQTVHELELAVAGPKASSRLVLSLPMLVFFGAGIAGIPIFGAIATSSMVWLSLVVGFGLFWLGNSWTSRILKKSEPESGDPGILLDALGIGLQAGLPLSIAANLVGNLDTAELQEISLSSGIALSQLVADRADNLRLEQFNRDRMKIHKGSVAVLWPLGLTVLPAFVLIAIVPVGVALVQSQ